MGNITLLSTCSYTFTQMHHGPTSTCVLHHVAQTLGMYSMNTSLLSRPSKHDPTFQKRKKNSLLKVKNQFPTNTPPVNMF